MTTLVDLDFHDQMGKPIDLDVAGKRVFLRCDLNVPLKEGKITDDGRIRASLPTINALLEKGASLVIAAHLGRPKGEAKPELSLAPIAIRLSELLGKPVKFAGAITGDDVTSQAHSLSSGEILLLENIRFSAAETSKEESERAAFAAELAKLADAYVGDGFGAVHRKHASVFDLPKLLPHAAGTLVAAEVEVLKELTTEPARPYGVVLGGAKVSDKLGVISNLLGKVDVMAIGGGMVFTFLAAQGHEIGKSLVEAEMLDTVRGLIKEASDKNVRLVLPTDIVVAPAFAADSPATVVAADAMVAQTMLRSIKPDLLIVDINMPLMDGFEFIERIRGNGDNTPALMLSARGDRADITRGLTLGADDYVTKPFGLEELVLRVRAILRRAQFTEAVPTSLSCGPITLDESSHKVFFNGESVELSPTEFRLLHVLLESKGRVLSKSFLLDEVWGITFETETTVVDTYISYLRKKLHRDGFEGIRTVRGVGFQLQLEKK